MDVLEFLKTIPRGKAVTYKFLAEKFRTHPRAIARILASNHNTDEYPCYKVIRSDRSVGGYRLGVKEKMRRLMKEGIVPKNGRIPEEFIWKGE